MGSMEAKRSLGVIKVVQIRNGSLHKGGTSKNVEKWFGI
jgi:hypothetical protein